jgi:hypothetical protein
MTQPMPRSIAALALLAVLAATSACQGSPGAQGSASAQGTPLTAGTGGPYSTTAGPSIAAPVGSPAAGSGPVASPVSMTLADGWRRIDLTETGLQQLIASLGSKNPQLTAAVNQLLSSGEYRTLLFYALGNSGSAFLGSVNVAAFVATFDLDGLAPVMESQMKSAGASDVTVVHVSLPAGPALRITYSVSVTTPVAVTVSGRAYVFLAGGEAYQVTFSCNGPDPAGCLSASDAMIQTFRIGS